MISKLIYIIGDVHGNIAWLNSFIDKKIRGNLANRQLADACGKEGKVFQVIILQCGDLAFYWPNVSHVGMISNGIDFLPEGRVPIYWCGGNHEDRDRLDRLFRVGFAAAQRNIAQVDDRIYFCRFGATLILHEDINLLFAGGSESVDKAYRLKMMREERCYKIWWEKEGISEDDMGRLESVDKVEWVLSHTAPTGFNLSPWLAGNSWSNTAVGETSRKALELVRKKYEPKIWFFDHFHKYMDGLTDGCRWEGLAVVASQEKSWTFLTLG